MKKVLSHNKKTDKLTKYRYRLLISSTYVRIFQIPLLNECTELYRNSGFYRLKRKTDM